MSRFGQIFKLLSHTLTTDNGREFAQHELISKKLKADFFFAHPYSSWERGANENMNGLIRQFFPKQMAFEFTTTRISNWPGIASTTGPENASATERHTNYLRSN